MVKVAALPAVASQLKALPVCAVGFFWVTFTPLSAKVAAALERSSPLTSVQSPVPSEEEFLKAYAEPVSLNTPSPIGKTAIKSSASLTERLPVRTGVASLPFSLHRVWPYQK